MQLPIDFDTTVPIASNLPASSDDDPDEDESVTGYHPPHQLRFAGHVELHLPSNSSSEVSLKS